MPQMWNFIFSVVFTTHSAVVIASDSDYFERVQNCTHDNSNHLSTSSKASPSTTPRPVSFPPSSWSTQYAGPPLFLTSTPSSTSPPSSTSSPATALTADADGDKCTGNDGSWKCGSFDSWSSYQSYNDINEAIAAQAALSALFEGSYESYNSDTTYPEVILGGPDNAMAFNFYDYTFPTYILGAPEEDVTYATQYAYRGRRNAHMSTHGVCEDQNVETSTQTKNETTITTTKPATTSTSSQKMAILFLPLFIFTLTL